MGYFARRKARKAAEAAQQARLNRTLRESYNHPVYGVDPTGINTALLYTTIASADVDHDEDVSDNADDTAREESGVDTQESYSYEAPEAESPVTEVYQPSYDTTPSYDSMDSGSSYSSSYDSGSSSSSYDSGSSGSFDSGSY